MATLVETRWDAWREQTLALPFPDGWHVDEYALEPRPALDAAQVDAIVADGIARSGLATRLGPETTVSIVVDDVTRPACWETVLLSLTDRLLASGVRTEQIVPLIGVAGHAPMDEQELRWKLGSAIIDRFHIEQHSFEADMLPLELEKLTFYINAHYMRADVKIALGTLIPHPFAGFSGGGKAIMPGIADYESIRRNHFPTAFGKGKVFDVRNPIREQMDVVARASGLDLLINGFCDGQRNLVGLHAGPADETFAAGLAAAQPYMAMPVSRPCDVLMLNAYPKDTEVLQISNALNVWRTLPADVAEGCRMVVLIAALRKGLGFHALFGPGGKLYTQPKPMGYLKGRPLLLFAPGDHREAFHQSFSPDYPHIEHWDDVIEAIRALNLPAPRIAFFHQASTQTANGTQLAITTLG